MCNGQKNIDKFLSVSRRGSSCSKIEHHSGEIQSKSAAPQFCLVWKFDWTGSQEVFGNATLQIDQRQNWRKLRCRPSTNTIWVRTSFFLISVCFFVFIFVSAGRLQQKKSESKQSVNKKTIIHSYIQLSSASPCHPENYYAYAWEGRIPCDVTNGWWPRPE